MTHLVIVSTLSLTQYIRYNTYCSYCHSTPLLYLSTMSSDSSLGHARFLLYFHRSTDIANLPMYGPTRIGMQGDVRRRRGRQMTGTRETSSNVALSDTNNRIVRP